MLNAHMYADYRLVQKYSLSTCLMHTCMLTKVSTGKPKANDVACIHTLIQYIHELFMCPSSMYHLSLHFPSLYFPSTPLYLPSTSPPLPSTPLYSPSPPLLTQCSTFFLAQFNTVLSTCCRTIHGGRENKGKVLGPKLGHLLPSRLYLSQLLPWA